MVEKVSEVNVNTALTSGSVSDDSVLLEWVDKKKKQNRLDEQPSSAAVTAQMLVQVLNGALTGGGWQQKENTAANAAAVPEPARPLSRSDDGLRQKVMLAASARTEATPIKPLTPGGRAVAAADPTKESESTPRPAISQPVALEAVRAETTIISQPLTARVTKSEDASRHPESSLQRKDQLNEDRPILAPGKVVDFRTNVQHERQVQTRTVPATLQQLKSLVNAATAAPSAKEAQTHEVDYSFSDDGLRQKVMLAASARTEATPIKPLTPGDRAVAAAEPTKESESTPRPAISQPVAVEAARAETTVISQPLTARVTKSEDASRHPESSLQPKDELNEDRTILAPGKAVDFRTNVQRERQVQTRAVPATLQQLKSLVNAATAAPSAKEAQTLEVDYSFQRWSGDHSVKVTIPAQALREGNITLLPSDARAADALSRNLGTLAGHSPELLQPRQERDEQQKREQQPQQDEEQE